MPNNALIYNAALIGCVQMAIGPGGTLKADVMSFAFYLENVS